MFLGADLSFVNEVEDNGGQFYDQGAAKDPFAILNDYGASMVRVRLWHTPAWTGYSTLDDVLRTIRRARSRGMTVLLDFHYSDTWADPTKQIIPAAWAHLTDLTALETSLFDYTLDVLLQLHRQGLMPEFVQASNEINTELLMHEPHAGQPIDWNRNARLVNAALRAIREVGRQTATRPRAMLHIAQPENIVPWFDAALAAGVHDFDAIGMSYYPKWSTRTVEEAGATIGRAQDRYKKDVMLVETAYPWTLDTNRAESHLLAEDSLLPAYPATPRGQRDFLIDLTRAVSDHGGSGVLYWEPAWISTPGKPSHWENATLFDFGSEAHEGIHFLSHPYRVRIQK